MAGIPWRSREMVERGDDGVAWRISVQCLLFLA